MDENMNNIEETQDQKLEAPVLGQTENITDNVDNKKIKIAKPSKNGTKIRGFGSCKFILSFMIMVFTAIAGATMMVDMFIMQYEQSIVNSESYIEYIKGTDIFDMINYFGDYCGEEKTFVITSIVCMIVTIGIAIVQIFLVMLWRNKNGYVAVMFASAIAIISEGIMVGVFLQEYVNSQYDAVGIVGYGPVIAIASHVFIIMLAGVTRKLTKINSVVNR